MRPRDAGKLDYMLYASISEDDTNLITLVRVGFGREGQGDLDPQVVESGDNSISILIE